MVRQQVGGDGSWWGIGPQTVTIRCWQMGSAAMPIVVFECEGTGVDRKRVELQ